MSRTRAPRLWGAVALSTLALTGCSALHPGVAVEVGERTISVQEIDEVAGDFCEAIEPQLESQAETIPNGYFRGGIAGTLALRTVAEELAEDYGVSADSRRYLRGLTELKQNVAPVPDDLEDSVILIESAPSYVEEIQASVGEVVLGGEGSRADFIEAGTKEFEAWIDSFGVEFDPALRTRVENGTITTADTALSYAASDRAQAALEEQPNAVLARQLPESQRCGR